MVDRGEPNDDDDDEEDDEEEDDIDLLSLSSSPSPNKEASKKLSPLANRRKYLLTQCYDEVTVR